MDGGWGESPTLLQTVDFDDSGDLSVGTHQVAFDADFTQPAGDGRLSVELTKTSDGSPIDSEEFSGGVFRNLDDSMVNVHGTELADSIEFSQPGLLVADLNGTIYTYTASEIVGIRAYGHDGVDEFVFRRIFKSP